jgi:DNA-binding response OmpR family regulator
VALLEGAGFQIAVASDGREAFQRLMNEVFDLSLMDVQMPHLSGLDVLMQMKALGMRVPSILMTGRPSRAIEAEALELGAITMLRKPIAPEVLRITIQRVAQNSAPGGSPEPPNPVQ